MYESQSKKVMFRVQMRPVQYIRRGCGVHVKQHYTASALGTNQFQIFSVEEMVRSCLPSDEGSSLSFN